MPAMARSLVPADLGGSIIPSEADDMSREMIADVTLDGDHYGVFYAPLSETAYSADRVQRVVAVFESQPIDATAALLSWKSLEWTSDRPEGTRIYLYMRSSSSTSVLPLAAWAGPFLNKAGEDISSQKGRYVQIAVAMYSSYSSTGPVLLTPLVEELRAICYMSGGEAEFYTKKFQLGFKPRHILLTYNGTIPDDALVQFAVAGRDSTDPEEYQVVTPNTIEELDSISQLSDGLKILIKGFGSGEVPFVIDELSVTVSGDQQAKVNKT